MALAAAVARQHLAERALQLGHERRAVLGREPDVAGDPERRQRGRTRAERREVALQVLRQVEQEAEPEQLRRACAARRGGRRSSATTQKDFATAW